MTAIRLYARGASNVKGIETAALQSDTRYPEDDEAAVADGRLHLIGAGRDRIVTGDFFVSDVIGNGEGAVGEAKIQAGCIIRQIDKANESFAVAGRANTIRNNEDIGIFPCAA